jgi:MFS family permease
VESKATIASAGLTALAIAIGIGRFAFTPILPMMQIDAGVSIEDAGLLAAANYVGYFLGSLSAMVVRPTPLAIRGALVVTGVSTIAMAFDVGLLGWIVLRTLAGIASAWVLIFVSASCLARLAPFKRPVLNSTVFAGVGTGITVAGLAVLVLMHAGATSARAWTSLGLLSLVATAIIWPVWDADDVPSPMRTTSSAHRWTGEWTLLVLCYGAFGFGYIVPATFLPVMARRVIADPAIFGWSWPIFGAAAIASILAVALVAERLGSRRLWLIAQFVMAIGVATPVVWPSIGGIVVAALAVGGTFMICTMTGMQQGREVGGVGGTRLMAAMTSAFAAGQIAGPMLATYFAHGTDDFSIALLVAALLLAAGAVALVPSDYRARSRTMPRGMK